ncbi:MAG: DUF2155 domain-containing protein [Deltaproteobacteria bacterium]|nr:DUF2155 domain-containing protein [Deltaproteobacteria bacterium]
MLNGKYLTIFAIAISLAIGSGCKKKNEETAPAPAATKKEPPRVVEQTSATDNKEENVAVPDSVKGKWKDVKIEVLNKQTNQKNVLVIPIGGEASIHGSTLKIKVENFLPEFSMDGTNITSASNDPKNPAVQIVVKEDGKEIFRGWLFALYSSTKFEHPSYSLTLVGYTPQ